MSISKKPNRPANRRAYYQQMRGLALSKREEHRVETNSLNLRTMRKIYKVEGIKIDSWDITGRKLRAAYFCDDDDYSVLVNKNLPREPKIFSLAHELKHHYADRMQIQGGQIRCGDYNAGEAIEIAAEIFAAEFIYPEDEMRSLLADLDVTRESCTKEKVVEIKRAGPAIVSYQFIVKRLDWFGLCESTQFKRVHFKKLEEQMFGPPIYKQPWFVRNRARKKVLREQ